VCMCMVTCGDVFLEPFAVTKSAGQIVH